jgi:hypothetical protein
MSQQCEPICSPGSTCSVTCQDVPVACAPQCWSASCAFACLGGSRTCKPECKGSTCTIECAGGADCRPVCRDGSTCDIDCTGIDTGFSGLCRDVRCKLGSQCLLHCDPLAGPCFFARCSDSLGADVPPIDCNGDGTLWACNRPCP